MIWLRCDAFGKILEVDIALILIELLLSLLDGTDLLHGDGAIVERVLSGTWIVLSSSFDIVLILSLLGSCIAPCRPLGLFLSQLDRGIVRPRTQWLCEEFMCFIVRLTLVRVQVLPIFIPCVVSERRRCPGSLSIRTTVNFNWTATISHRT